VTIFYLVAFKWLSFRVAESADSTDPVHHSGPAINRFNLEIHLDLAGKAIERNGNICK
jgi:hypothetical protein